MVAVWKTVLRPMVPTSCMQSIQKHTECVQPIFHFENEIREVGGFDVCLLCGLESRIPSPAEGRSTLHPVSSGGSQTDLPARLLQS